MPSEIPVRSFPFLIHAGELDRSLRKPSSHEGDGLSVSLCPDDWERIARLGEPSRWDITMLNAGRTGEEMKLIDIYALMNDTDMKAEITEWAIEAGLARQTDLWCVVTYDGECEEVRYSYCRKEEDAQQEAFMSTYDETVTYRSESLQEAIKLVRQKAEKDGDEVAAFARHTCLTPSEDGIARSRGQGRACDSFDMAAVLWARDVGMDKVPGLVGAWWNDVHEPSALSAPRGVIFTEAFSQVDFLKRDARPDIYETEYHEPPEVETLHMPMEAGPKM